MKRCLSNDSKFEDTNRQEQNRLLAKRLKEVKPTITIQCPFSHRNPKLFPKKNRTKTDLCNIFLLIFIYSKKV